MFRSEINKKYQLWNILRKKFNHNFLMKYHEFIWFLFETFLSRHIFVYIIYLYLSQTTTMNYENQSNVFKNFPYFLYYFRTKQKIRTISFELLSSNVFTIRTKRYILWWAFSGAFYFLYHTSNTNHFRTRIFLELYKVGFEQGFEHPYKETYAIYEKFPAFSIIFKDIFKNILTYFYLYSLSML